jgi:hypothetical protein
VHLLDLAAALLVTAVYGLAAEANPAMRAALGLGPLGGLATKAALLAVIFAAAALNPSRARLLVGGGIASGVLGAVSALVVLG